MSGWGHRAGYKATTDEIEHAVKLLKTDLDITTIVERVGRTRSFIQDINRKYGIRQYDKQHRSEWTLA